MLNNNLRYISFVILIIERLNRKLRVLVKMFNHVGYAPAFFFCQILYNPDSKHQQ